MSHTSMMLSGLLMLAMALFIAPNVFASNRGRVLRNIAIWLAIFVGLGVFYQNFGPESAHPLFQLPESMSGLRSNAPSAAAKSADHGANKDDADDGSQGFTPPKE